MASRRRLLWAIVGALIASGCGCQDRGPYSPIVREDEQAAHQHRNGVTMLDKDVRNALMYRESSADKLPSGQVRVRAQMENIYPRPVETLWADYRVVFYKEAEPAGGGEKVKMEVDSTEWQTAAFPPREVVLVQGTSLRNDVTSYNVQFKDLRSACGNPLGPPMPDIGCEIVVEEGLWREGPLPD